jgi:ABC-type glycerol-3-phosphate transport system substrate-binding protein
VRRTAFIATAALAAATLAACGGGSSTGGASANGSGGAAPVTLTLWHNYGTEQNAVATQKLTDAYTKLHPDVTFKLVSQPGDNYFSLLQAAAVSKSGPDLAVMWTGLFTLKYKSFLTNLKDKIPADQLKRVEGLEWMSDQFDANNGPYVMPLEKQFYIGFYSKKAFAKAGVAKVPTTWDELYAACDKLKAAGLTPLVYGNGGQSLGAEFYPWYDASYLMIGALPVDQWKGVYDGSQAWNGPAISGQFSKWAGLKSRGCANSDILTKTNNLDDFTSGKAAMIVDGTWDTQKFTDAMKDDVAAFVPPFSDSPIKGVVEYPGDGFSVTSYSQHQKEAADFLAFLTTDGAAKVINEAGLIPAIDGTTTTNPVNQQMLEFAAKQGFTRYPMLDNVVQGDVVDAGNKLLPSILAGKTSPGDGLTQLLEAWKQLPADARGTTYR